MKIKRYLTICFVVLSSIWHVYAQIPDTAQASGTALSYFIFLDSSALRLQTTIQFNENSISGITIAKLRNDTIRGVFMNEFGIKAFEFIVYNGACTLQNTIAQLQKKYIIRTLQQDLAYIFYMQKTGLAPYTIQKTSESHIRYAHNKKTGEIFCENNSVIMNNVQRQIRYTFIPIL